MTMIQLENMDITKRENTFTEWYLISDKSDNAVYGVMQGVRMDVRFLITDSCVWFYSQWGDDIGEYMVKQYPDGTSEICEMLSKAFSAASNCSEGIYADVPF